MADVGKEEGTVGPFLRTGLKIRTALSEVFGPDDSSQ